MFENETFEGVEEASADSESSGSVEQVPFDRETGEVTEEPKKTNKRVKRTEQQMIASFNGNSMHESVYVLERISKLEDKMSELLNSVGTKAQAMIVSERPELSRFVK